MNWLSGRLLHPLRRAREDTERVLNDALDLALQWDALLSPIQARLHALHPDLHEERLDEMNLMCQSAVALALEIALGLVRHGEGSAVQSRFHAELSLRYPWLNDDNKERLFRYSVYQATKTARIGDLPPLQARAEGADARATGGRKE